MSDSTREQQNAGGRSGPPLRLQPTPDLQSAKRARQPAPTTKCKSCYGEELTYLLCLSRLAFIPSRRPIQGV